MLEIGTDLNPKAAKTVTQLAHPEKLFIMRSVIAVPTGLSFIQLRESLGQFRGTEKPFPNSLVHNHVVDLEEALLVSLEGRAGPGKSRLVQATELGIAVCTGYVSLIKSCEDLHREAVIQKVLGEVNQMTSEMAQSFQRALEKQYPQFTSNSEL